MALIPSKSGKVVVKVDMLVEGTDVPPGMGYRQAARKAVAACVSDFAAKGVRPESFLVSLGIKWGTTQKQVDQLARGLDDAQKEWKVELVGGDTNEASELVIDVAMLGSAKKVVGRNGAKPGDVLVVTGPFGYPPSGLKIMMEGAEAEPGFRNRAVQSVLKPKPDLNVGLALAPFLTSSIDSSDGLARSLHTLAGASKVGFELSEVPEGEGVARFARANGFSGERLVFSGGEEYLIIGTVRSSQTDEAEKAVSRAGGRLSVIGVTTAEKGQAILRKGRRSRVIKDEGWTHLG